MAKFSGWKKRYSYLDDYKKGMDGKYVYYGKHYAFRGTDAQLKWYKGMLGITSFLAISLFVISGLMDAGALWSCWYVIIPFALEILAIFVLAWKAVTLLFEKNPVKSYIYKRTVPWFKPMGIILMVIALISIAASVICMLLNPETVKMTGCIVYMVLKLAQAVLAFVFVRMIGKYQWDEDPSEEVS